MGLVAFRCYTMNCSKRKNEVQGQIDLRYCRRILASKPSFIRIRSPYVSGIREYVDIPFHCLGHYVATHKQCPLYQRYFRLDSSIFNKILPWAPLISFKAFSQDQRQRGSRQRDSQNVTKALRPTAI